MNRKTESDRKKRVKNLLRLFAFKKRGPRRASGRTGRTCRKSLIINDQILRPPPKSSGNIRFCPLTAPTFPEPIRSNPKLRAETPASGRTANTGLNGRRNLWEQHPQLAPTCTYLRQPAPTCGKKIIFSGFRHALAPKPLSQRNACARPALGLKTACKHNRTVRAEHSSARSIWKGNHVKRTR
jgi:hypothetical protein